MPRMTHPATGRQRIVPTHSVDRMRGDGWVVPGEEPASPGPPSASDPKHVWVDYAVEVGHPRWQAERSTKADLVEALS